MALEVGIGMQRIQELMRDQTYEEPLGQRTVLPPIIKAKFPFARNCTIPLCQSCLLARARKRTPGVKHAKADPEKERALSRDRYEVGDFVSTDQFICRTPGCLPEGYGRESPNRCFHGGTIYNDAASGLILGRKSSFSWCQRDRHGQSSLRAMALGYGLSQSQALSWR